MYIILSMHILIIAIKSYKFAVYSMSIDHIQLVLPLINSTQAVIVQNNDHRYQLRILYKWSIKPSPHLTVLNNNH